MGKLYTSGPWQDDVREKFLELEDIMHTSGIIDKETRLNARVKVKQILEHKMRFGIIGPDSDAYEEVKIAFDEAFYSKKSIASLGGHTKFNLLYNKEAFERNEIPHERVSLGAHFLANNYAHKNLTIGVKRMDGGYSLAKLNELKQRLPEEAIANMRRRNILDISIGEDVDPDRTSTKLDEDLTRGLGLPESTTQNLGENANDNLSVSLNQDIITEEEMMRQQTLDEIMAGNAENIYTSLIPQSKGGKGFNIGVFYIPEGSSPKDHRLIGAMNNPDGSKHVITEEELIGASASNQILEYLASWWFDYGHKNVEKLYKEGKDHTVPGPGRAVPGFDMSDVPVIGAIQDQLGYGIKNYGGGHFGTARRAFSFMTSEMGELEFKHAIEPLYLMLQAKAKELNVDYLSEEQSQDVLRSFSDRFNRSFSENLEHEPFSYLKGAARWVANFWEYDVNLREVGYAYRYTKEQEQAHEARKEREAGP